MKLLVVCHRYIPYPGGTEYFCASIAEEALSRGHQVAVFTGEHQGDQNGVRVTNDSQILLENWDLIIIHGANCPLQDYVLNHARSLPSPICYMVILPKHTQTCINAMNNCKYVAYSTLEDIDYLKQYNVFHKGVQIRHGIKNQESIGQPGFKTKYGITGPMFLSCGGYWPNKALPELAALFEQYGPKNSTLVMTGYDNRYGIMPKETDRVKPLMIQDKKDVMGAILEADSLIMHSFSEGFGLVLLEASLNKTRWIAREIAGAKLLKNYGDTYTTDEELISLLNSKVDKKKIKSAYDYVIQNHLISHTVTDIENILK